MLKYRLFKGAALLVIAFGALSALFGMRMLWNRVVHEAQTRVRDNLRTAWSLYDRNLSDIEQLLRLAATKPEVIDACATAAPVDNETWHAIQARLETFRTTYGLDFLTVVGSGGSVRLRSAPPHTTGDPRLADPIVLAALGGKPSRGTTVLTRGQLALEGNDLADRAFLRLSDTPRARPATKLDESRGLVALAAVPVERDGQVVGAVYGGILLNRNTRVVDGIREIVFRDESHNSRPLGSVTVFLDDCRVATTVFQENGQRAYGSRASQEVADRVLDQGMPWVDRAFVVRDWYLAAYEPIRNPDGQVLGMLYVGLAEQPYRALARSILLRYALLSAAVLLAALGLALFMAARIAGPLHRLVVAASGMGEGAYPDELPVPPYACDEAANLIRTFNQMTAALKARERELQRVNDELEKIAVSLKIANRNYMEAVQFVSHELKRPVATMVNYVHLLKAGLLGDLTEKQRKAAGLLDTNLKSITEMIRDYLNLARIENNELRPILTRVGLRDEIVQPLLESFEAELTARGMRVDNAIAPTAFSHSDLNMTREIFDNLIGNAIKYGRDGGCMRLECRPANGRLECSVRNDGAGVAPEEKDKLFHKFSRLGAAPGSSGQRGTGLGLFIVKQIVEAHGGTVSVESDPGHWVEFRFSLPEYSHEDNHGLH